MTAVKTVGRNGEEELQVRSPIITANTGISLGVLLVVLGIGWKLIDMSNSLARWQARVDLRLDALEQRVASRPDPWSGTMMKELALQTERELRKTIPGFEMPDTRAIQDVVTRTGGQR